MFKKKFVKKKHIIGKKNLEKKFFRQNLFQSRKKFVFNFDFLNLIAIAGCMCVIIYPELNLALIVRLTRAQLWLVLVKPFYKA